MNFLKRNDVGSEIYFTEWSRSDRKKTPVVKRGLITKVGLKNIGINESEYRMIEQLDHCLVVSRGSTSDHYIRIFRCEEDVQAQHDAFESRRRLANLKVSDIPLDKVNQILDLISE